MDLYGRVRHAVLIDGMSRREAAKVFGIDPRTVAKMLAFSVPPAYRRRQSAHRPKLDAFTGIIDQILEADKLVPKKQRHTSKRVFERLRDEYGFEGGITIVKPPQRREFPIRPPRPRPRLRLAVAIPHLTKTAHVSFRGIWEHGGKGWTRPGVIPKSRPS